MRGYYRQEDEIEKPKPIAPANSPGDVVIPVPRTGPPEEGWYRRGDTERRHHVSREPEDHNQEHLAVVGHDNELHVFSDAQGDDWVVWLNTGTSDFDGLVLGVGASRQEAVTKAVACVEAIERALQGTPASR